MRAYEVSEYNNITQPVYDPLLYTDLEEDGFGLSAPRWLSAGSDLNTL